MANANNRYHARVLKNNNDKRLRAKGAATITPLSRSVAQPG